MDSVQHEINRKQGQQMQQVYAVHSFSLTRQGSFRMMGGANARAELLSEKVVRSRARDYERSSGMTRFLVVLIIVMIIIFGAIYLFSYSA